MEEARIPERYKHCDIENFKLTNRLPERSANKSLAAARSIAEMFAMVFPTPTPFGLLFMGPPGIGKTHLAVGIIKRLIRLKSVPCLFRTFPDLLKEIQMSYNPVSHSSELSLMQPVLETDVLVLDELGAQTPSTWVKETVGYILNSRYNDNRVTILTTNYIDDENFQDKNKGLGQTLVDRIGSSMRSRLYEMCKTVIMTGEDYRQEQKQKEHKI
jgi:DNA replication protein DnaC